MDGDGYLIYMSSSPGHEGTTPYVAHLIESATGYTIAPLADGTRYYFRVALLDHFNGKSAQSAEVSAVPVASPGSGSGSSANTGTQGGNGGGAGGNGGAQNVPGGGVTTQPTTPTGPGQAPGQRDTSSGSSAGLIIGLAALSLAGAGGAVAIVLIQRRRQGRGYAQVPTPRRPYDDEPAGPFGRTEEKSGPRYR
jgi:hypothetical protein